MKISVLINCYNYEAYVGDAVRSVGAQSRRPDELIVVDDGSTDESVRVVREAVEEIGIGRVVTKENGGQFSAFQTGIENTDADWVFFLDADDAYESQHLERYVKAIEENPQVEFVTGPLTVFGGGESDGEVKFQCPVSGVLGETSLLTYSACLTRHGNGVMVPTSSLAIKKSLLDRIFPLENEMLESWRVCADFVLESACFVAGAQLYIFDSPSAKYRVHGQNSFFSGEKLTNRYPGGPGRFARAQNWLGSKFSLDDQSLGLLAEEYASLGRPSKELAFCYLVNIFATKFPFSRKYSMARKVLRSSPGIGFFTKAAIFFRALRRV